MTMPDINSVSYGISEYPDDMLIADNVRLSSYGHVYSHSRPRILRLIDILAPLAGERIHASLLMRERDIPRAPRVL